MSKDGKTDRSNCATACALEVVGDRWSLLIVRDFIFMGRREYGDFLQMREGIASNTLVDRLMKLTESGIFTKHAHPYNKKKFYYEITDKGFDLIMVIMALAEWGWNYLPGAWSPPQIKRQYKGDRDAFRKDWKCRVHDQSRAYLISIEANENQNRKPKVI